MGCHPNEFQDCSIAKLCKMMQSDQTCSMHTKFVAQAISLQKMRLWWMLKIAHKTHWKAQWTQLEVKKRAKRPNETQLDVENPAKKTQMEFENRAKLPTETQSTALQKAIHTKWTFKKKNIPASDPKQCAGGHQQRILYVSLPIRAAATNRMKSVYKTYVCVFCTLRISRSSAGAMSPIHVLASTNMDPRQDPHLRIHVSASLCLRLLCCKIHVSRFMSQHPCVSQDPLQDPCLRIHISAAMCISGSSTRSTSSDSCLSIFVSHRFSARSMSPDSCLSIFLSQDPLQDPCLRIHVSDSCLSIHQYGPSARSMSAGSCLSIFASQDSLQDPCLRIHVSASLYLRSLYKIHVSWFMSQHPYVSQDPLQDPCLQFMSQHLYISGSSARSMFGFMSQHLYISGSSARSMSPDPYISIHMYLRILCKIHVSGFMSQHPFVSQDPLQDPRLRIHISAAICIRVLYKIHVFGFMSQHLCISGASTRSMSPIHVSASTNMDRLQDPCLRFMSQHPYVSQDPLQDPCLQLMSQHLYISGSSARSMFGFMSQHLYISGSSARSMSPDPYISIFASQDPLQDPCLRIHVSASNLYLRILCKIHVSGSISQQPYVSGSSTRSTSSDSCLSIFVSQEPLQDPCLRFMSQRPPIWTVCKIHVSDSCLSVHQYGWSARSMSPDSCLSIHMYLRILCKIHVRIHVSASLYFRVLCKIHVSGSIYQHPYVSQDPLQDPCLRIHVSASICISGSSARSTSPDPYLSSHMYQGPLQDPRLRIHVSASLYLRSLYKIHVPDSCLSVHQYGSSARSMSPDSCLSIHMYLRILCKIHVSNSCLSIFISQGPL